MINTADMINAAFKANKQRPCPASTSQSAASSDPTVTIPGPSYDIPNLPVDAPSATVSNMPAADSVYTWPRLRMELDELRRQKLKIEALRKEAKQIIEKTKFVKWWMNDVRKAAIEFGDIEDELCMEMGRLQEPGYESDSLETRSVRRKMMLKIKDLWEEQEEMIRRASLYGLGAKNGDMLQCGACGSLQANHSLKAVPTYVCY